LDKDIQYAFVTYLKVFDGSFNHLTVSNA